MRDRNVISWAIVSLVVFLAINAVMSSSLTQLAGHSVQTENIIKDSIIAIIVYAVGIIISATGWRGSFYLMVIIVAVYSLSYLNMFLIIFTGKAGGGFGILALVVALAIVGLVVNGYWLVLALRHRQDEQRARDRRRFGK